MNVSYALKFLPMNRFYFFMLVITCSLLSSCNAAKNDSATSNYPIQGVPFNKVQLKDQFWLPKIEINRTVTIPASFQKCEEEGRLENFLIAGGQMEGEVRGSMPFDDTDVYKIIEGASYSLTTTPDSILESYVDSLIGLIAVGQEADGYLTTWKTIDPTRSPAAWCPPGERWEGLAWSHELYNSGHLFEAATAHYRATGSENFLDIAIKNADLLVQVFGDGVNVQVPGHQIVETGLVKLYNVTGNEAYLKLARHFLDGRGDSSLREVWGAYNQDHLPVIQQRDAVGHAVRAVYMYAGMTDMAVLYNDSAYRSAVDALWENVVYKKTYITGGIGARHDGEAFGENYELPNLTAYNETCAAIGNVYWNYRMFLLHGHAKYMDVLERSLYNGVVSGVGMDGKTFFYPNPLSCDLSYAFNQGALTRKPWFDCSCCPTNLCRFMPSVPGYVYATSKEGVYVNLFVDSETQIEMAASKVDIHQKTIYPWDGDIRIGISPEKRASFKVMIRIPGWVNSGPLPGDLYHYVLDQADEKFTLKVNEEEIAFTVEKGYAIIDRLWAQGDEIYYHLPMPVKEVLAHTLVEDNRGKIALERGPVVYCVEAVDNADFDRVVASGVSQFEVVAHPDFSGGIRAIKAIRKDGDLAYTAIPYYTWNNRGPSKMKVWLDQ